MQMNGRAEKPICAACGSREQSFLCSLSELQLPRLDRDKVSRRYRRGQVIFYEATPSNAVYCIASGLVKLYKVGPNDQEIVIRLLRDGDVMGYRALIAGEVFSATAQAVEDTTVCTIPKETLFDLLQNDVNLGMRLMAKLAVELRLSEEQMVTRIAEPAAQRTARILLWLLDGFKKATSAAATIDVPLRREEMAQIIGTTPETLSRVLRDFEGRGILHVDRRTITILETRRLRDIAQRSLT